MSVENQTLYGKIESILYVAGDPVSIDCLAQLMDCTGDAMALTLRAMETAYTEEGRGIIPKVTDTTVQFITNPAYVTEIEAYLQPEQTKSVSKSLLETLAVVAYKQPVTRADIESVRGVRCDYAVTQLLNLGFIEQCGRKDALGHPALFQTTDLFLRKFGLHTRSELPGYMRFSEPDADNAEDPLENV